MQVLDAIIVLIGAGVFGITYAPVSYTHLEKRRDVLCDGLNAIGWKIPKPEATMFVWAPIPEAFTSSEAFAVELVKRSGVLVTPGSAFGPAG